MRLLGFTTLLTLVAVAATYACSSSDGASSGAAGDATDGGGSCCTPNPPGPDAPGDGGGKADADVQPLPAGSFDPSFGTNGRASVPGAVVDVIVPTPDDGVLVARSEWPPANAYVTKLSPTGAIDTTYGTSGTVAFAMDRVVRAHSASATSNGVVIGMGTDMLNGPSALGFGLLALDTKGAPAAFGTAGYAGAKPPLPPEGSWRFRVEQIEALPDGSWLAAGGGQRTAGYGDAVFARWKPDGTLDPTFGNAGAAVLTYGDNSSTWIVAMAPTSGNMHLVALGFQASANFDTSATRVVRITSQGTIDDTFGTSGVAVAAKGAAIQGVALPSGGFLLVADGYMPLGAPSDNPKASPTGTLAKLSPTTGTLDTSFGAGGLVVPPVLDEPCPAQRAVVDSKGRILVLRMCRGDHDLTTITRLTANGAVDVTFGTGGSVKTKIDVFTMAVDAKDRLLVGGVEILPDGGTPSTSIVARILP